MKKLETILILLSIAALIWDFFLIAPGGAAILILSVSALSLVYGYFSFLLFNGISARKMFKKSAYLGTGTFRIVGSILLGFPLSAVIIGTLFKLQTWPGGNNMLMIGLSGLLLGFFGILWKYSTSRDRFYSNAGKRVVILGVIGLSLFSLSEEAYLGAKYRNHPAYLELLLEAMDHPTDKTLWKELDEERKKIY